MTITVGAYAGIVTGAEHEFMNLGGGANIVAFAAATTTPATTIKSVSNKLSLTANGAACLKYLGGNTFLLIGSLET